MSKADKLRKAAQVAWVISGSFTAIWVWQALEGLIPNQLVKGIIVTVIAIGFQYVVSLVESVLFDGSLPAPWSKEWSWEGSVPWLWAGAIVCLFVDVMLNLGGVSVFTARLTATDEFVASVSQGVTVILAILFAVAPELLNEFADFVDGKKQPRRSRGGGGTNYGV